VLGRVVLLALAALCAVAGVLALRGDDRCAATVARARALTPATARAEGRQLAAEAVGRCAAAPQAVVVASYLGNAGRRGDAERIAVALTRREPRDYLGWLTLARLEQDPARARVALRRAHALDPRGVPAAP
jgi:hypothetical protein